MLAVEPARGATLRLSVTDRCNLRCRYCMPASGVAFVPHRDLPTLEELRDAVQWLAERLGVDRVKITGGEPLVRRGLPWLVDGLRAIPGVAEVSMTTNATLLDRWAGVLKKAGLTRVNVSLDSLDSGRFYDVTRGGRVDDALRGIDAALNAGLSPIKINSVLRRSSWEKDIPILLDFAAERGLEVRFIELMRTGTETAWTKEEYVSAVDIRESLGFGGADWSTTPEDLAPARTGSIGWKGKPLQVGWITPVSHAFCSACNRLRLDARGRIRRCLMDPAPMPLVRALKQGPEDVVEKILRAYLAGKSPPQSMITPTSMNRIGG